VLLIEAVFEFESSPLSMLCLIVEERTRHLGAVLWAANLSGISMVKALL
jgi:hypothetical protein